jgi:cation transport regulator ChaC
VWVFGYGSLVWRPALAFCESGVGFIEGWVRRFWQGSMDHRGVPEAPGRVVTLVPEAGAECWGVGYRVPRDRRSEVLKTLDHREKGGYERRFVDVHLRGRAETVKGLIYLAKPSNPNYLGPAPLAEIVSQVRRSYGPSGSNVEYVQRLAAALREMEVSDDHVFELEAALNVGSTAPPPPGRRPARPAND